MLPIRRILWTIIQPFCRSQSLLLASVRRYDIDIIVALTLRTIGQILTIRTPSMQVAGCYWGNQLRFASRKR